MITLAQVTRLRELAAAYEEMARRFAGYHQTSVANGEDSIWNARSTEERINAEALRALLAALPAWTPIPSEVDTSKAPFDGEPVLLGWIGMEDVLVGCYRAGGWTAIGSMQNTLRPSHYAPRPTPPIGEP